MSIGIEEFGKPFASVYSDDRISSECNFLVESLNTS